ncbi:hypothetical protein Yoon_05905 [Yoonia sp. I 8.24]|nr:hypothetical protein [Yoonia sp. I 8.24]
MHFKIPIDALTDDPIALNLSFRDTIGEAVATTHQLPHNSVDELSVLRKYLGAYQTFFLTPAWPDRIHVGLVFVSEADQRINTVFFNRARDPETQALHRSRLDGTIILRGERLFLMEKTRGTEDRFSETILFPSHRHSGKYLTGMSFGVTWRPHRMPFASRTIWRRMSASDSVRAGISNCGIYHPTARPIDPIVKNFFSSDLRAYTMTQPLGSTAKDTLSNLAAFRGP